MRFQNKNWRLLQIFYTAVLWEAIQVCSEFPFGQEEVLLGITLPAAHPVPGSELAWKALKWSHQSQREVNLSAQCFA